MKARRRHWKGPRRKVTVRLRLPVAEALIRQAEHSREGLTLTAYAQSVLERQAGVTREEGRATE